MFSKILDMEREDFKSYISSILPWLIIILMALNMLYQHTQFEGLKDTIVAEAKAEASDEFTGRIDDLKNEISGLKNDIDLYEKNYEEKLLAKEDKYSEDMRLMENYQYVMKRDGYSLTEENIRTLEKYAKDDDMPDVNPHLVFAMIYLESQFNPNEVNKGKYIGLGQICLDTAKYVKQYYGYEDTITKETLKDPNLNLKYHASYIRLLFKTQKRNWYNVIMTYSGARVANDPNKFMWTYIGHLNKFLSRTRGTSFQKIIADNEYEIKLE